MSEFGTTAGNGTAARTPAHSRAQRLSIRG